MKYLTNCKNIETAIRRAQDRLISTARESGLYENFGAKEYRVIENHFIRWDDPYDKRNKNIAALKRFGDWAGSYTLYGPL